MPFLFMQFTMPHNGAFINLSDISFATLGPLQNIFLYSLLGIMFIFTLIHLSLILFLIKELIIWFKNKSEVSNFLNSGLTNIGMFSPIISITMSMYIVLGPIFFFIPKLANQVPSLMFWAFLFWSLIWTVALLLEAKVIKVLLTKSVDVEKMNFGWLLDSFTFGMIALVGSFIASLAVDTNIASMAAFMTLTVLIVGLLILGIKFIILFQNQLKASQLPEKISLLSIFIIVPITCLYGVSFFRLNIYLENVFNYNIGIFSYFIIMISYIIAGTYLLLSIYLIRDYLFKDFLRDEYHPSQWVTVCALVGFEVLGLYVYSEYYSSSWIPLLSYVLVLLASLIYLMILGHYLKVRFSKVTY